MNRLVLIGNGYDLAAGLKTSYEDFLLDLFKCGIKQVVERHSEDDFAFKFEGTMFSVEGISGSLNHNPIDDKLVDKISTIKDILAHPSIRFTHQISLEEWIIKNNVKNNYSNRIEITIHSDLLKKILGKYNWRDVESFYFQELLSIYEKEEINEKDNAIEQLNEEFEELKNKLVDYMAKISEDFMFTKKSLPLSSLKKVTEKLNENTFHRFFNNDSKAKTLIEIEKIFLANFNYTPTLGAHFLMEKDKDKRIQACYIHGKRDEMESVIFGYGDDSHPSYAKIEQCGNDEYLKHIKSFHYPKSKSYIDLMNFIETDQFEVQIIGHSLGLSDRVLLKSIFENKNCKMIKIYHREKKEDMIHKYMALSRHCSNKEEMRRKILEFDESDVVNDKQEKVK